MRLSTKRKRKLSKVQITVQFTENFLSELDEASENLGVSRSAYIINAVNIYKMFTKNQINLNPINRERDIKLSNIEQAIERLTKEEIDFRKSIENEMKNLPGIMITGIEFWRY
jgi:predicted phage-related endonuclease